MKKIFSIFIILITSFILLSCNKKDNNSIDYSKNDSWAVYEASEELNVDTFFLAPCCSSGDGLLDLSNEKHRSKFKGTVMQEIGIYTDNTRFFAPYYKETLLNEYEKKDNLNSYLENSYKDVYDAFKYYLENFNNGNYIILAGFSEGADMSLRLLKDFVSDDNFYNKFVSCYAIGWIVTNDYLASNSRLKMAESSNDLKSIISFTTEAIKTTKSFIVGENDYTNSINPLFWKRDNIEVDKSYNLGAVFLDTYGNVTSRVDNFTGCYIDSKRGVLKVTDVKEDDYDSSYSLFSNGVYHIYDYQFFYNNLKENVKERIKSI